MSATQANEYRPTTSMQKKVLLGGSIGQFVEFYDFTLYGLSAVILTDHFFPAGDPVTGLLVIFATFGVAFGMRPLGGLFFGALGDKIGRRKTLTITIFLVGACTALIGILPGFATIGWAAPILLVLCRLGQGFSAGGESVGGPSFVYEHAPVDKRGMWINITLAATALPSVCAGGLILLLSSMMSDASFDSWGWRIPFLLALPLSGVGLWIRSRTEESELFKAVAEERPKEFSPIRESFRENWKGMLQVFFVLGLTALGFYMLSAYFVTYIQTTGDLSREQALLTNALAMASYTILLPIFGHLSDRFGRKPLLITGSVLLAVSSIPAFGLVTSGNLGLAFLGQTIFVISLTCYGGGCYTFFCERFSTRTRFTSAAISYNISYAVFGGTAPFVGTWLVEATGVNAAPGWYMSAIAVAVLALIVITRLPETRGRLG
ncbi:MHS family proline/betaine transporter-like MFS transporter [Brevibacterium sanguinis]|uniref:MHS family proline/betaine transporter-like MFS transporter n=2 Tax=Brevibacterium TaxID=1696 RepID=A0A366IJC1_9MICO|nr:MULTISPECIES: MFS transporter [Brevibacterium]RBP62004.1 MHS family proline/betaine transporter-like MFS transporter [Brevibacterium sanguinis]RBP70574.1 MHS family proline/betaine transporter-like MFS transporter [Brevibacterium celere]